jgi:hypothetical protein
MLVLTFVASTLVPGTAARDLSVTFPVNEP